MKTDVFVCQGESQYVTVEPYGQTVRRRAWPSGAALDETVCHVTRSGCAIQEIAASPSGRWLVTSRHSGQGEWGYDVLRTCPLAREAGTPEAAGYMLDLPRFSEDESRLVGGFGEFWLGGWWSHIDDDRGPARGGPIRFGSLLVHRLPGHQVERHELWMDLPEGWIPDEPESELWLGARSVAPIAEDGVRLILPGGVSWEFTGRLPPLIWLPTPHPSGGGLL